MRITKQVNEDDRSKSGTNKHERPKEPRQENAIATPGATTHQEIAALERNQKNQKISEKTTEEARTLKTYNSKDLMNCVQSLKID